MLIGIGVRAHCKENDANRIRDGWATKRAGNGLAANRFPTHHAILPFGQFKIWPTVLPLSAISVIVVLCVIPTAILGAPISQTEFATLASRCAPAVPAAMLEAVARTESGLDPWALHDNTTGRKEEAGSPELAVTEAQRWLGRGDSVDIGLMQINASNLRALGITVSDAFDPCASLAGGAAVLMAAYGGGATQADQQAALLMALSRYNTGTPFQGVMNGYARTVLENVGKKDEALPIPLSLVQAPLLVGPNAPPSWNVSATGVYAQLHGASWLIDLAPSPDTAGTSRDNYLTAARQRFTITRIADFPTSPTAR